MTKSLYCHLVVGAFFMFMTFDKALWLVIEESKKLPPLLFDRVLLLRLQVCMAGVVMIANHD